MSTPAANPPVHAKGSTFVSRIAWVRLNYGEAGLQRLAGQVSAELGQLLRSGAVMAQWYPLPWFIELSLAIDQCFGQGDMALVKQLGRYSADANLTTIYRLFFKANSLKWILSRSSRIWGMYYDSGRLLTRELPGNAIDLEIAEFATPHRVHCLSMQGWVERAGELSGARGLVVDELDCRATGGQRCLIRARW